MSETIGFRRARLALAAALCLGLAAAQVRAAPPRIPTLLLSGSNNHDWRTTTPRLKAILEATGRFTVTVTERPGELTAAALAPYRLVVSNWNTFGMGDAQWPEAARRAISGFVPGGKGWLTIHAGGSSFYDWPDYQRLAGPSWTNGVTSHGAMHRFVVQMSDAGHPITHGLRLFITRDELWNRPGVQPGAQVLATAYSESAGGGAGRDEPVLTALQVGRGRTCGLTLGHDVDAMATPGFGLLLARAAEWAATGAVTQPIPRTPLGSAEADWAAAALRTWRSGDPNGIVWALEHDAGQCAGTPGVQAAAKRLLTVASDAAATLDGRRQALRLLTQLAGPGDVPALAALAKEPALTADVAALLTSVPGKEAAALRAALPISPPVRVGSSSGQIARAAAELDAASAVARPALLRRGLRGPDAARLRAAVAYLAVAPTDVVAGLLPAAAAMAPTGTIALLDAASSRSLPTPPAVLAGVLTSARPGMAAAAVRAAACAPGAGVARLLLDTAKRRPDLAPAIRVSLSAAPSPGIDDALVALAPSYSGLAATIAYEALAERCGAAQVAKLMALAEREPGSRRALLPWLADRGGAVELERLLHLHGKVPAGERGPVTDALTRMAGRLRCTEPVLRAVRRAQGGVRVELLTVLGACEGRAALAELTQAASSADPDTRASAVAALGAWTTADAAPALLESARSAVTARDRTLALRGLARVAPQAGQAHASSVAPTVVSALALADRADTLNLLLTALASLPSLETLKAVEPYLASPETTAAAVAAQIISVEALAGVAPPEAREMAVRLAASSDPALRSRAAEALVRMDLGPNVALGARAETTTSNAPDGQGGGAASAIDGSRATYWDETDDHGPYGIRVILPAPRTVGLLRLVAWAHHDYSPRDFEVVLDGATVRTMRDAQYDGDVLLIRLEPTRCTSVELRISGWYGKSPAIRELEIYERTRREP
ncbi:MAG: ThuA domain-containing protein [Armatimonadetes bacterium]|nr:ThuA domain-containing protein [Armatimonadota bacterium]